MCPYFFGLTTFYIFGQKFLQFFCSIFGKFERPKIHSEINSPLADPLKSGNLAKFGFRATHCGAARCAAILLSKSRRCSLYQESRHQVQLNRKKEMQKQSCSFCLSVGWIQVVLQAATVQLQHSNCYNTICLYYVADTYMPIGSMQQSNFTC